MAESLRHIYTVSQITTELKLLLEETYSMIWITGEISNFSRPASGHYYFVLKDEYAQIQAVIFRGQNRRLAFAPKDGMQITGIGRISIYEPRGSYQVILEHIEPKGIGALQIAFEQLKAKLAEEGLFDPQHKKPLPFLPETLAVVTSPTGAVIHDIIQIIRRRFSAVKIQVVPVRVQGAEAADEIAQAIHFLNQSAAPPQIIILARGGGSLEDLQAFNSEVLARAIFASNIPIVSAIGHETDFTIADFTADLRAPTPSAAAELVVPDRQALIRQYEALFYRLRSVISTYLSFRKNRLVQLTRNLRSPQKRIQDLRLRIDDHSERLRLALDRQIHKQRQLLNFYQHRLLSVSPRIRCNQTKILLEKYISSVHNHAFNIFKINQMRLQALIGKLLTLDPTAILNRGYSITRSLPKKAIVRRNTDVAIGQMVEVLLSKGVITCHVEGTYPNDEEKL